MPNDEDKNEEPRAVIYRVVPGGESCEMCDAMAGDYPSPPEVPIHPNCECTIEEVSEGESNKSCHLEVRGLESYEDSYSETEETQEYTNDEPHEQEGHIEIPLSIIEESFDPGVEEELGWSPPYGDSSASYTAPGNSTFTVSFEIEYTRVVCKGELWKVCVTTDPVAGMHTEEVHVADVGGTALARTGILSAEAHDAALDNRQPSDVYYHNDEEVPV